MALPHPTPPNEFDRLVKLAQLEILGTPRAVDFDATLALALQITGCTVGQIGFLDADKHWFKAQTGIGCDNIPRQTSLCNHALMQAEPFIIEDLSRDARFRDNIFVAETGLRFYAGIALTSGGLAVGTLCVLDEKPRAATPALWRALETLGCVIEGLVESHALAIKAIALARKAEARERDIWKTTRLMAQSERLAKIGAWEMNIETNAFFMSDECYRIHDLEIGSAIDLDEIRLRRLPIYRDHLDALFDACLKTGQGFETTGEIITVKGNSRWTQIIAEAERHEGKIVRVVGTLRDITIDRHAERTLWRAAHYDALTQAPNRHYWNARLEDAFAAADTSGLTIFILDLDGFKEINDTRGHAVGDDVLREIARRLGDTLPESSFHARLGGDEFAILLLGVLPEAQINAMVRGLLAAIRKPIVLGALRLQVSGTLGSASYPVDAATANDLMQKADIALYQAKRSHRTSFVAFRPNIGGLFDQKRQAIDLVAMAIEDHRLVPFYQRKTDLATGGLLGFEALCRVETVDGAILGPSQFLPALRDPASAARIGVAMLGLVTADIAAWLADGLSPGRVALNVTGADFADGEMATRILDRLAAFGLPASVIEIEVTENTILGEEAMAVSMALQAMSDEGISIALDDFGTGYASLTHLRDAPINVIKLDRSFVAGLGIHADSTIIVKSIVDLGHCLGMRIVAEGIETRGQADFLRAIGCDEAQGFLFGQPASRTATRAFLSKRTHLAQPRRHLLKSSA